MRTLKISVVALLVCVGLGLFARQSKADAVVITLNENSGGQTGNGGNFPASTYAPLTGPYAQITLTQSGDTITVSGETLNSNINFYDQTSEGGIFGFGPVTGTVAISGCMVNGVSAGNECVMSTSNLYDGYGTYSNSVGIVPTSPPTVLPGTTVTGGYAFSTFSFILTDTSFISDDPSQILNPSPSTNPGAGVIASDVCEDLLNNPPDTTSPGCNTNGSNVEHTYVSVTPEPGSYLLFGTGLLALGIVLRKKQGQSVSQI